METVVWKLSLQGRLFFLIMYYQGSKNNHINLYEFFPFGTWVQTEIGIITKFWIVEFWINQVLLYLNSHYVASLRIALAAAVVADVTVHSCSIHLCHFLPSVGIREMLLKYVKQNFKLQNRMVLVKGKYFAVVFGRLTFKFWLTLTEDLYGMSHSIHWYSAWRKLTKIM
jgi:hypothetical protein